MKWLLTLYPRAWQRRYRQEMAAHLEHEPVRMRTVLDLVAGAADAWMNPQSIPPVDATPEPREGRAMITASRCHPADISRADAVRSAIWVIAVTLVLTSAGLALDATVGDHVAVQALLHSAFFIAFTISSRYTYLKPYSRTARNVITLVAIPGWYGFFLAANLLGSLI